MISTINNNEYNQRLYNNSIIGKINNKVYNQ